MAKPPDNPEPGIPKFVQKGRTSKHVLAEWPADTTNAPRVAKLVKVGPTESHFAIYVQEGDKKDGPVDHGWLMFWVRRKAHALHIWEAFKEALIKK